MSVRDSVLAMVLSGAALATGAGGGELTLSAPLGFSTPSVTAPKAVALADFNKDQRLDAVVVGLGSGLARYAVCVGNGDGTFGAEAAAGSLYLDPSDLVVDDFDGDGNLDIAALNNACG